MQVNRSPLALMAARWATHLPRATAAVPQVVLHQPLEGMLPSAARSSDRGRAHWPCGSVLPEAQAHRPPVSDAEAAVSARSAGVVAWARSAATQAGIAAIGAALPAEAGVAVTSPVS